MHSSPFFMRYFLNIGSNLGNPKLNLSRALRAIEEKFGWFETSKIMETKPWGFVSPHTFANMAVMVISDKTPQEVLCDLHEIEARYNTSSHRDKQGNYRDRVLDIDIMAADDILLDTPELKLPHPHLAERDFFLVPFSQLAPLWRHPLTGLTCDDMIALLPKQSDD